MQAWETRLLERKRQFLSKLPARCDEMVALVQALESDANDRDSLVALTKHFHKLAGAGGIYEMPAFCDDTIAAEEFCTKLIADDKQIDATICSQLLKFCEQIRRHTSPLPP